MQGNGAADKVDAVVVGAGVVGLAVARALALAGHETIILEKETTIGTGTSSRNSEVIHAGIYYPKGSLKARLCVAGRKALYAYCDAHGVPYRRCGKLIVAIGEQQRGALERVLATARGNGVDDIRRLSREEARALEPELACCGALLSPSTGILDSHAYMLALLGDAQANGAMIAYGSTVAGGRIDENGIVIDVASDGAIMSLAPRLLVNSAGLEAQAVASSISGLPAKSIPSLRYAKGNYFQLVGRAPFKRLIYPVPEPGGLGVHITIDLGGQAKFGPDVEWIEKPDYTVDPSRAARFYAAIRQYWPALPDGALEPGYSGIRPKLPANGADAPDFVIQGRDAHGVAGLINLYGIESPGLTSSLAIADYVAELAEAAKDPA
ncbi:MAG: NAD(P)/FAD-dependent oxidoreductase [Hyphomicrobiales bacterium]|nr:NAD(P)/FAD-dependent oxidoreductase [Hyphomicrobiales bacterium]